MRRSTSRVAPRHLAAAALTLLAVLDLASGLGLLPHHADRAAASTPTTAARRPRPTRGTRALRVVAPAVRLRPGDRVDVLVTLDPDRYPSAEPTRTVGEALTVLAVDRTGPDTELRGATLAVPRALVPRVAFAATAGTLTLAVVPDRRPHR